MQPRTVPPTETGFDDVVVGAGAGGGPLAADLAAAGMRTLLLDGGGAKDNDSYLVPAFHADAYEDPTQCWNYFVRHYADDQQQRRDSKLVPGEGLLYSRAGTIGECTAHHAPITVCPYHRDWDAIAVETGDASWHSTAMRRYFERPECCTYRPRPKKPPGLPLSTTGGHRSAVRESVRAVQRDHPAHLVVRTHAPAARIVLDEGHAATGVDYLDEAHAYRADPGTRPDSWPVEPRRVLASREVILAAAAFNTPQLLMLSGIEPPEELGLHGIPVRVGLYGVGAHLQDRYEVGVVSQMPREFPVDQACDFHAPKPGAEPDHCYRERQEGKGLCSANGAVLGITRKSRPDLDAPDLFIFGGPFDFRGYRPGYSLDLAHHQDRFTWAFSRAAPATREAGSGCARQTRATPPLIDFHYFAEGTDKEGLDLETMADAVEFVRGVNRMTASVVRTELWPGEEVDDRDAVRLFVQDEAWGHHASCTCRMGRADDRAAVVDSTLRVRGVDCLRIVDASVFPPIPGFFVAAPHLHDQREGERRDPPRGRRQPTPTTVPSLNETIRSMR
ncbi:GMC family oxidoreductase [Streptomyces sp. NPDC007971]|uniref:GMC family oxidoreductase n=1 Tax=Streptomyces sp. NPDC007971 TaxID=3364799 RepID=UPI0036E3A607